MIFAAVIFGSIALCFADLIDGDVPRVALTPAQKFNEMLTHVPGAQPLPMLLPNNVDLQQSLSDQKSPCVCGVFLSSQFTRGSGKQPVGSAALMHEYDEAFACNVLGVKTCTSKCLDIIAKYLPNSPAIICGSVDRDIYRERAYLFVKNCNDSWINTNLSAGREYCCKDGHHYKCPMSLPAKI